MRTSLLAAGLLLLSACGVGEADLGADGPDELDVLSGDVAPLLGVNGSGDAADRLCNVVLRELTQATNATNTGASSSCTGGKCWFVWNGTLEVSKDAIAAGAKPYVLFESTTAPGKWFKV